MLGTKFELDNDKLIALGYDPQEFELKIDEVAQKIGLIKVGKSWIWLDDEEGNDDLVAMLKSKNERLWQ